MPYCYLLSGEQKVNQEINILTNTINNFAVLGYLLFGVLMNFTSVGLLWSYVLLIMLGLFLLNGLPSRIQRQE